MIVICSFHIIIRSEQTMNMIVFLSTGLFLNKKFKIQDGIIIDAKNTVIHEKFYTCSKTY